MRDGGRLDGQELGVATPRAAVAASLVPDPDVAEELAIPRELDGLAVAPGFGRRRGPRAGRPRRRAGFARRASGQRSARSREPSRRRTSGHAAASVGWLRRACRLVELERAPAGQLEHDLGVEELEAERDVLERRRTAPRSPSAWRSSETSSPPSASSSRRTALRPCPLQASVAELASSPTTDHGSFEARPWKPCRRPSTAHGAPGVREEHLPAAAVGGRPGLLVEVAGDRRRSSRTAAGRAAACPSGDRRGRGSRRRGRDRP